MPRSTVKYALRMAPETQQLVKEWFPKDNCQTQNEYIEKAIHFYTGYISGQEATAYLPAALVAALQGTVQNSEARTARLLFKLAVEVSMMAKCGSNASRRTKRPTAPSRSRRPWSVSG